MNSEAEATAGPFSFSITYKQMKWFILAAVELSAIHWNSAFTLHLEEYRLYLTVDARLDLVLII